MSDVPMYSYSPPFIERTCWICLSSENDYPTSHSWCSPCKCRGALKWVHNSCLQRWISEQQRSTGEFTSVSCQICKTQYQIIYPKAGHLYTFLSTVDQATRSVSYIFTGLMVFGSFYWSAVTYGAFTVMQIFGNKLALENMRNTDPPILLLSLPTVPLILISVKAIPWESAVLFLWRQYISRIPFIHSLTVKEPPTWQVEEPVIDVHSELSNVPRLICSALLLPTISTVIGRLLFKNVETNLHRVILGAITYVGVKGIFNIYYRERKYLRMCYRRVKNYEEELSNPSSDVNDLYC